MITELDIHLPLNRALREDARRKAAAQKLEISPYRIKGMRLIKESIDARRRPICKQLRLLVGVDEELPPYTLPERHYAPVPGDAKRIIIVGSGPGGLFAALRSIELGMRPVVLERGKDVSARRFDLQPINCQGYVVEDSNYCFGEGGAGTFSDGKLFTRATKRGPVMEIYETFVAHGAAPEILTDAHPHIGSNRLPNIIKAMRGSILAAGGEVHFQTKMTSLIVENDQVRGIRCGEREFLASSVILATGHSARDVYRYLHSEHIEMEAKGLAIGVRLEHPSHLIDQIQYHSKEGRGKWLPAAEYSMVRQAEGRGVYSFCMCPGGVVVPAASGPEQIVVNGMSPSNRGGRWSNSGMVVEIRPEDIMPASLLTPSEAKRTDIIALETSDLNLSPSDMQDDILRPLLLQEQLERMCWLQGNRRQTAPSQRMADFVNNRLSADLNESTYAPGLIASPLHFWMPRFITTRLQEGFKAFGRAYHGFLTNEANMIAIETRTSAPVRILRQRETLQHVRIRGLFPCGEGAGYAGGIVSAGVDGERCAEMAAEKSGKMILNSQE